jgi:hypothetical protein
MYRSQIDQSGLSPYLNSDSAHWNFQYLEDIATGYWYAQVLFTAVELNLFGVIDAGCASAAELAGKTACKPSELSRLLTALQRLDLIHQTAEGLFNSQLARRFLVPGEPDSMGDFIWIARLTCSATVRLSSGAPLVFGAIKKQTGFWEPTLWDSRPASTGRTNGPRGWPT